MGECTAELVTSVARQPSCTDSAEIIDLRLRTGSPLPGDLFRLAQLSWVTAAPVTEPKVMLGTPATGYTRMIDAKTSVLIDETSGARRYLHRARLTRLTPGTRYTYLATSTGGAPAGGSFRTDSE